MDIAELMADDAANQAMRLPKDDELKTVAELANEQIRLEGLVAEQELALKVLKEQLTRVSELSLPAALEAFGLTTVTLLDGSKVTVKENVYAGITEENEEAAFEWLEATDNDGIIKHKVECNFGKGQGAEAQALMTTLSTYGYSFTNARTVHPQTLKAFVRKQLEEGLPVPTNIFSIHIKKVASIDPPKKKK